MKTARENSQKESLAWNLLGGALGM